MTMTIPLITLNDGTKIPQIGLGTWKIPDADAAGVVSDAIAIGYRLIDTASEYKNEVGVGAGIAKSGTADPGLILATKLWNANQGYDTTLRSADDSLKRLGRSHIDLYLIHWPSPAQNKFVETWKAFIELRKQGKVRSIGVCNFTEKHLERIIGETGVVPAVNQIELSPELAQIPLRAFHEKLGIATQSWSPLARGQLVARPPIIALAEKHKRTPAQVILRWHVENGLIVIPKSANHGRLVENIGIFDFSLDADDMAVLAQLDCGRRLGPNPDVF